MAMSRAGARRRGCWTRSPPCSRVARVVFVDDVHAADEATLDVLALPRAAAARAPAAAAARLAQREPSRPGHPLRRAGGDGACAPGGSTRRRWRRSCAADEDADLAERVCVESEGLPLFVAEYLATWPSGGAAGARDARPGGGAGGRRSARPRGRCRGRGGARARVRLRRVRAASGRGDDEATDALEELVARGHACASRRGTTTSPTASCASWSTSRPASRAGGCCTGARPRRCCARGAGRRPRRPQHLRAAGDDAAAADAARHRRRARRLGARARGTPSITSTTALELGALDVHERMGDLRTLMGDYAGALSAYETARGARPGATSRGRAQARRRPPAPRRVGPRAGALRGRAGRLGPPTPGRARGSRRPALTAAPGRRPGARGRAGRAGARAGRDRRRPAARRPGPQPARDARRATPAGSTTPSRVRPRWGSPRSSATSSARTAALNNLALVAARVRRLTRAGADRARRWRSAPRRATATARRRWRTTSPTSTTPPADDEGRWRTSSARSRSSPRSAATSAPSSRRSGSSSAGRTIP